MTPKVLVNLVQTTGLPPRTGRRTVPDMFRHHRSNPTRELASLASAFNDRLGSTSVSFGPGPRRVDPGSIRRQLSGPSVGLRERLDRGLRTA